MITSPNPKATPRETTDFLVFLEIAFASGAKIINPESQNIGIDTINPVIANANSSLFLPKNFIKVLAILSAAPDTSKIWPIITPKPMIIPMLPKVPPKPLDIESIILLGGIPPTSPVVAAAIISAKNV